jgi:localization factor PodJL
MPEFRPIVLGASTPEEPARIRSSFIAALRRNQAAEGREPGGGDAKAPGRRLQTILLVGAAAAALGAGAWSLGGPARLGAMVAALTGSAEAGRPSGPARKALAQSVKTPTDRPKHQEPIATPTAGVRDPAAEAGARTPPVPAEAARPTETPPSLTAPAETASLAAAPAARPAADDLPPGIPARLKPAVAAGNPSALYELASLLVQGREMPKDPVLGAKMLERAALAGLVPAQFSLGQLYETGVGVAQDLAQAQVWYRRAAERGNTYAMQNLGVLVAAGTDGKSDYPAAIPWFRQAADLGVRDSQYNLAVILAWGMGTPRNPVEAYKWFALAAKAGDQEAAAKRDELARELSPADLSAAKALAETWRARTTDRAANTVPPVPQGLSDATPAKAPSRKV